MPNTKSSPPDGGLKLVTIEQLAKIKKIPIRTLRTMAANGVISRFVVGHRTHFYNPAQFDRDLARREVRARGGNGNRPLALDE